MEWISIKDKLPEQKEELEIFNEMHMVSEQVLTCSITKDGTQCVQFDYFVDCGWQSEAEDQDGCLIDESDKCLVTHWTPIILPEPKE